MKKKVCIVIPCFKVSNKINLVIKNKFLNNIDQIVLVDDLCPERTGKKILKTFKSNKKIKVLFHKRNKGVGGATITGFKYALKKKFDIIIKIDGDDQHDLSILSRMIKSLKNNYGFAKGYRELSLTNMSNSSMPIIRLIGAKGLTFLTRLNTGNLKIKDACHGFIGFNYNLLNKINLNKLKNNYLFEQDIIFEITKLNGNIFQIRNEVKYADEKSSLNPIASIIPFLFYHIKKFFE